MKLHELIEKIISFFFKTEYYAYECKEVEDGYS